MSTEKSTTVYFVILSISLFVNWGLAMRALNANEVECVPLTIPEKEEVQVKITPKDKLIEYISGEYRATKSQAKHIVETVYTYTESTNFPPPKLVFAVIAVESSFRPEVESHKGAKGLMQVMPINEPGETMEDNIIAGIWVLQQYRSFVSTDEAALAAYNVGITAYKKGRRSNKYVAKVQKELKKFEVLTYNF